MKITAQQEELLMQVTENLKFLNKRNKKIKIVAEEMTIFQMLQKVLCWDSRNSNCLQQIKMQVVLIIAKENKNIYKLQERT